MKDEINANKYIYITILFEIQIRKFVFFEKVFVSYISIN